MAASFLSTLSRAARTAYPLLVRAAREGFSTSVTASIMEALGFRMERQTITRILRHERDVAVRGAALRFLPRGSAPDPARIPTALGRLRREFSFTMEVRGFLHETRESIRQRITISSSELLRREEMERLAIEAVASGPERYKMDVESVVPIQALRAGLASLS